MACTLISQPDRGNTLYTLYSVSALLATRTGRLARNGATYSALGRTLNFQHLPLKGHLQPHPHYPGILCSRVHIGMANILQGWLQRKPRIYLRSIGGFHACLTAQAGIEALKWRAGMTNGDSNGGH